MLPGGKLSSNVAVTSISSTERDGCSGFGLEFDRAGKFAGEIRGVIGPYVERSAGDGFSRPANLAGKDGAGQARAAVRIHDVRIGWFGIGTPRVGAGFLLLQIVVSIPVRISVRPVFLDAIVFALGYDVVGPIIEGIEVVEDFEVVE